MSTPSSTSTASAATTTKPSTLSRISRLTSVLLTLTHTLYLLCEVIRGVRCWCLSLTAVLQVELGHGLGDGSGSQLCGIVLLASSLLSLLGRCGRLLLGSRC